MNFIKDDRWHYIADGLKVTLIVTFCAVLIGVVLGFLLAIVRSTYDKTGKMKLLNLICQIYITVIRGTPVVVQLLIIYFVIFASVDVSKTIVAMLMLLRFSVPVLWQLITDSLRQDEALDLIIVRQ